MAYEEEFDFQTTSKAIQDDLLLNATDITATELLESADGVKVPVIKEVDGIPKIKRVTLDTLTGGISTAISEASAKAQEAQAQATRAESAARSAQSAVEDAREAISEMGDTVATMQEQIDAYLSTVDQGVKARLVELGQMADTGKLDVRVESYQLFEDFVQVTGYTGTYEQFLAALLQGGGGMIDVDTEMSSTSTNPVQNKAITVAMAGKQDTLEFLTSADINAIVNL